MESSVSDILSRINQKLNNFTNQTPPTTDVQCRIGATRQPYSRQSQSKVQLGKNNQNREYRDLPKVSSYPNLHNGREVYVSTVLNDSCNQEQFELEHQFPHNAGNFNKNINITQQQHSNIKAIPKSYGPNINNKFNKNGIQKHEDTFQAIKKRNQMLQNDVKFLQQKLKLLQANFSVQKPKTKQKIQGKSAKSLIKAKSQKQFQKTVLGQARLQSQKTAGFLKNSGSKKSNRVTYNITENSGNRNIKKIIANKSKIFKPLNVQQGKQDCKQLKVSEMSNFSHSTALNNKKDKNQICQNKSINKVSEGKTKNKTIDKSRQKVKAINRQKQIQQQQSRQPVPKGTADKNKNGLNEYKKQSSCYTSLHYISQNDKSQMGKQVVREQKQKQKQGQTQTTITSNKQNSTCPISNNSIHPNAGNRSTQKMGSNRRKQNENHDNSKFNQNLYGYSSLNNLIAKRNPPIDYCYEQQQEQEQEQEQSQQQQQYHNIHKGKDRQKGAVATNQSRASSSSHHGYLKSVLKEEKAEELRHSAKNINKFINSGRHHGNEEDKQQKLNKATKIKMKLQY